MKMRNKKVIVVLGMHRSGTSAIARGIIDLGCEFGSMLWPANISNIKGFYENVEITNFNNELLQFLGLEWHSVVQIPEEKFNNPALKPFRKRAIEIISRNFAAASFFGFKCPRACRLLPFWQGVFSEMEIRASYAIVIRNPLSIAMSLDARDGFPLEKSFLLWLVHILPVIRYTQSFPRVVIDYDIMMDNPISEIERIAEMLAIDVDSAHKKALRNFATLFLEENLRHTQFSTADTTAAVRLPRLAREAYDMLLSIAKCEGSFNDTFVKDWQKIEHAYNHDNKIANLTDILVKCETQTTKLYKIITNRENIIVHRDKQIADLNEIIAHYDKQIVDLNEIIANRENIIAHRDKHITGLTKTIENLEQQIADLIKAGKPPALPETNDFLNKNEKQNTVDPKA